jgi:hypothetical protein
VLPYNNANSAARKKKRGILSKHWTYFENNFGGFSIEYPLSSAMEDFIKNNKKQIKTRCKGR